MQTIVLPVLALLFAGTAAAQDAARPQPADSRAAVPEVTYQSAFEGYRPYADQEPADWRKANEEAGAGGGHAGHYRAQPGAKPEPADPKGAAPKRHHGHGGHK